MYSAQHRHINLPKLISDCSKTYRYQWKCGQKSNTEPLLVGFHQLAMNYANYMTYQRNSAFESQLAAITLRGKDNFEKQMPSVEIM